MIEILLYMLLLYLVFLLGCLIGIRTTSFCPPKGLWALVPFRVSGWKSPIAGKVYKINWAFESVDYDEDYAGPGEEDGPWAKGWDERSAGRKEEIK